MFEGERKYISNDDALQARLAFGLFVIVVIAPPRFGEDEIFVLRR
jgi:hypothetical protein